MKTPHYYKDGIARDGISENAPRHATRRPRADDPPEPAETERAVQTYKPEKTGFFRGAKVVRRG